MDEVILFNSYLDVERTRRLRAAGFCIVLLDVSEAELRRRQSKACSAPTGIIPTDVTNEASPLST